MPIDNIVDMTKFRNVALRKKVTLDGQKKIRFLGARNGKPFCMYVDPNFEARASNDLRSRLGMVVADEPKKQIRS